MIHGITTAGKRRNNGCIANRRAMVAKDGSRQHGTYGGSHNRMQILPKLPLRELQRNGNSQRHHNTHGSPRGSGAEGHHSGKEEHHQRKQRGGKPISKKPDQPLSRFQLPNHMAQGKCKNENQHGHEHRAHAVEIDLNQRFFGHFRQIASGKRDHHNRDKTCDCQKDNVGTGLSQHINHTGNSPRFP